MNRKPFQPVLCLAAILVFPVSADAAECPAIDPPLAAEVPQRPETTDRHCPAVDPVGRARLRVFLDRRTGRLRAPTPEEARALYESSGPAVEYLEPLEVVTHPNGMRSVDLKGAFSFRAVTRRNPDGSLSTVCRPAAARPEEK
ncbi:MAG: post-PEP-CTERM-1 domain-containing protein [Thermoanaerobaculia bacterium]